MNTPDPQSTLREWWHQLTTRATCLALAAVAAVLTVVAPFDTDLRLSVVERGAYWAAVVFLGYAAGLWANVFAARHIPAGSARIITSGALCAILVLALMVTLNLIAFGYWPDARGWVTYGGTIVTVALIVNTALAVLLKDAAPQTESSSANAVLEPLVQASPKVPLLDRLPLDKRAALVALSVEDHYVRVRTRTGEELLLMRLSDAIREVGDTQGAQVHRSHWAAWQAVAAARREGDRAILTMSHGPEIPVSRANMARIKEAGLLPR